MRCISGAFVLGTLGSLFSGLATREARREEQRASRPGHYAQASAACHCGAITAVPNSAIARARPAWPICRASA